MNAAESFERGWGGGGGMGPELVLNTYMNASPATTTTILQALVFVPLAWPPSKPHSFAFVLLSPGFFLPFAPQPRSCFWLSAPGEEAAVVGGR